jgi:hypothetical protein
MAGILLILLGSTDLLSSLSYYTIQSNLLCLGIMIVVLMKEIRHQTPSRLLSSLKCGAIVVITITFLVYNLVLAPVMALSVITYPFSRTGNILVHVINPIWFLLDYLLFDSKGKITKKDALGWVAFPVFYYIYILIYSSLGGLFFDGTHLSRYPYFFLNPEAIGSWGVVIALIVILGGMMGLSYILIFMDGRLAKKAIFQKIKL